MSVPVQVGDMVEIEVGGTLLTPSPVRVRVVIDTWVFVDGSNTGIEIENIKVIDRP